MTHNESHNYHSYSHPFAWLLCKSFIVYYSYHKTYKYPWNNSFHWSPPINMKFTYPMSDKIIIFLNPTTKILCILNISMIDSVIDLAISLLSTKWPQKSFYLINWPGMRYMTHMAHMIRDISFYGQTSTFKLRSNRNTWRNTWSHVGEYANKRISI